MIAMFIVYRAAAFRTPAWISVRDTLARRGIHSSGQFVEQTMRLHSAPMNAESCSGRGVAR